VPLAQTEWAALGPRIQGWAALADVRVHDIRVEYLGDSGLANAAAAGLWRHTLFLGADLLANTDWRQRDAVIGHELGHIRLGHMRANAAMSLLKAGLAAGAFAYLDIQGTAIAIVRLLHPDLAEPLDARFGPPSYWPLLGAVLAFLWLGVQSLDRWRRHQHELACDRFSVGLAGDPLAKALVLVTIHKLASTTLNARSYTHPSAAERIRALLWMLSQPAPFAPWANWPVPAIVTFAHQGRALTVPLASAPPIAPLPPAPWSRMPPLPAQPAPALVIVPGAGPSAADTGGTT
jgi:Zn-dependent protease with chaperone function